MQCGTAHTHTHVRHTLHTSVSHGSVSVSSGSQTQIKENYISNPTFPTVALFMTQENSFIKLRYQPKRSHIRKCSFFPFGGKKSQLDMFIINRTLWAREIGPIKNGTAGEPFQAFISAGSIEIFFQNILVHWQLNDNICVV